MTDTSTLRKTFNDAHAADYAAHKDAVERVLGMAESLGKDFLEVWPKAAPVLTAVANFVRFIPGLGSAGPVLKGLIAVGDAIYKSEEPSAPAGS